MEEETVGQRLKRLRDAKGWSQAKLAKEAGLKSQGTVGNIEAGTRGYGESIVDIARALGTTPDYLRLSSLTNDKPSDRLSFDGLQSVTVRSKVPRISWIQAGAFKGVVDVFEPGEAEYFDDVYEASVSENAFSLLVVNDSMESQIPGTRSFPDGTVIIVDPNKSADAGDYVIAKDVDTQKATFKKLVHDGGRWYLKPLNPTYPTIEIDDPSVRIIGKVVEYIQRGKLP